MECTKIVCIPENSNIELRTCPFCGELDFELVRYGPANRMPVYGVYCDTCGAEGPTRLTISEALTMWNVRSEDKGGRSTVGCVASDCKFDPEG